MNEKHIQETCAQFLELDGWRRLRTDPVSDTATVQAIRRRVAALGLGPELQARIAAVMKPRGKGFGEPGMPDDFFIRYDSRTRSTRTGALCEHLWVEWKAKDGRLSDAQRDWHRAEKARGALVVVAGVDFDKGSIEAFETWYFRSGLNNRMVTGEKLWL